MQTQQRSRNYLILDDAGTVRAVRPLPLSKPYRRSASIGLVHALCLSGVAGCTWVLAWLWTVHTFAAGFASATVAPLTLLLMVIGARAKQESGNGDE